MFHTFTLRRYTAENVAVKSWDKATIHQGEALSVVLQYSIVFDSSTHIVGHGGGTN